MTAPDAPQPSGVGGIADCDFDYVFTDQELQDILQFMEKQGDSATGSTQPLSLDAVPLSNQMTTAPAALQFQPHASPDEDSCEIGVPGSGGSCSVGAGAQQVGLGFTQQLEGVAGQLGDLFPKQEDNGNASVPRATGYGTSATGVAVGTPAPQHAATGPEYAQPPASIAAAAVPAPQPLAVHYAADGGAHRSASVQPPRAADEIRAAVPFGTVPGQPIHGAGRPVLLTHTSSIKSARSSPSAAVSADGKPQVSHSQVEKQRRDRINSLIDELRELVPPQCNALNGGMEPASAPGADTKRPKHVVLSDTITLVKEMRDKIRLSDAVAQHRAPMDTDAGAMMYTVAAAAAPTVATPTECATTGAAVDLIKRECFDSSPPSRQHSSSSGSDRRTSCEMPIAPDGVCTWSGVIVEQGEDCLYVKVNCKDRRGLLSDVIMTLKSLPIEIKTAAITTTREGHVFDVFQVTIDHGTKLSARQLQCQVHTALHEQSAGCKRVHTAIE